MVVRKFQSYVLMWAVLGLALVCILCACSSRLASSDVARAAVAAPSARGEADVGGGAVGRQMQALCLLERALSTPQQELSVATQAYCRAMATDGGTYPTGYITAANATPAQEAGQSVIRFDMAGQVEFWRSLGYYAEMLIICYDCETGGQVSVYGGRSETEPAGRVANDRRATDTAKLSTVLENPPSGDFEVAYVLLAATDAGGPLEILDATTRRFSVKE